MSEFISLYSGSSGNSSSVVRCGERYLFIVDMGKGVRTTGAALKELELNISDCDGILVTHEHSDHVKGLSTFLKKYPLPVYGAEETLEFLGRKRGRSRQLRPDGPDAGQGRGHRCLRGQSFPHQPRRPLCGLPHPHPRREDHDHRHRPRCTDSCRT